MNKIITFVVGGALLPATALCTEDLRQQIQQLKQEYETRIQALEQRLESLTQPPASKVVTPGLTPLLLSDSSEQISSGTAFNPALSIIMDGVYYQDNQDGETAELAEQLDGIHQIHTHEGETEHEHAHGSVEEGFNVRDVELAASATVDPYFDARAQIVFSEENVAVEEAYFLTRRLPAGLQLKGGKFLSDIGYANNQHPHQWDFTDQSLPYSILLGGHGLSDSGLQLTWLPELDVYLRLGLEVFQGDNENMAALVSEHHYLFNDEEIELPLEAKKSGPRMWTSFLKFSPDLGYNHALQGGLFYVRSIQQQELHGDEPELSGDQTHALAGKSWLLGTDWVYQYDSAKPQGQGDLHIQAEYLYQVKDLALMYHASQPELVGTQRQFSQDGFYLQAVYGLAPRIEAGLRYDVVGLTNELEGPNGTLKDWDASQRWGLMLAFRPTEYSVLRAQFSRADFSIEDNSEEVNQFWLQYQLSLGVHGAHTF